MFKNATRRWAALWLAAPLLIGLAAAALAESLPVRSLDGGGARAGGTGYLMSGVIGGLAMPTGSPHATGALYRIQQGFYSAVTGVIPLNNAADPAWLLLGDLPADAAAPAPLPARAHVCLSSSDFSLSGLHLSERMPRS